MKNAVAVLVLVSLCLPVYAGIQDYQIIRLITMKSYCNHKSLERTDSDNGTVTFFTSCLNVSHYPDGIFVICSDPENEQTCKIQTQAKQFNHLKLLQN
jgi:hypothetical protein